ncbi:MAG: MOSC domain-containing protein [Planctomycetota bacterium]
MQEGKVIAINIAPHPGEPTVLVDQIHAVPGKGLEGDHHFPDNLQKPKKPDQEVTLIEKEAIESIQREYKVQLSPKETRRNIITENIALNHLVEKEFSIGEVVLKGLRLCEPCSHLEKLTVPGVQKALIHRGGLRAQILSDGMIHKGDRIRLTLKKGVS